MSAKKSGLGRGFDSLIPTELLEEEFDPTAAQDERVSDLRHLKLSEIIPDPDQPRRTFDEVALTELATSIKEHGILQPIVVTPVKDGYMIVAGERRYRAALKAGLEKIPTLIRTLSNQHKLELSLIENLQRRDLNVLETATAYLKLRDQFNLTLDEIGHRVGGKSASTVSNTLRLLRLPESVRKALAEGKISEGQARPLVNLDDEVIAKVLPRILAESWSSRTIEHYIGSLKKNDKASIVRKAATSDPTQYKAETTRFERRFRTPIQVRANSRGAGQIVIKFKSEEEFRRIASLLDTK